MPEQLEQTLRELDRAIDEGLKSTQKLQSALRRCAAASRSGALRDIGVAVGSAVAANGELSRKVDAVRAAGTFDFDEYFASGGYSLELLEAAQAAGLRLFDRDGRIACPPMLVTVAAKQAAVRIDRKAEKRVRPSVLVRLLAERQKRPPKFNAADFLETLWSAYTLLAPRIDRDWVPSQPGDGPAVQLAEIHGALTLLPGSARDYALAEFTRDVHLLDTQPDTRTRDGRGFRLEQASGARTGRRLTMVDAGGNEHLYVAIRFLGA